MSAPEGIDYLPRPEQQIGKSDHTFNFVNKLG